MLAIVLCCPSLCHPFIRKFQTEETQEKEYQEIVGERPSPINSDLVRESEKYEEAHLVKQKFFIELYVFLDNKAV